MSKKCIYCGAELEDDDLFCDVCGRKQEENTSHKAVQTPSHEETSAVEEKTKEEVVLDVSQATEPEPQQASEAKDIVEVKMSEPEKAEEKPEQKSEKVLRDDAAKTVTTQPKSGIRKVRDIVLWILTVVMVATVYKGNIIKNLIMDCQSYTKYRPNETTGGIFVSWRRKEELPTGA